ncbi:MAG: YjgP/YjgQ family permease [Planctomycetaceae bacterium]|jgi:lipopolysaccharide export system permease protein|nr:YjgP/YjgQ family permease [Planctomycetaceae bacterium]
MKIITRYVLSEMLQVFLVALTALTLFMLVIGLTKEAQQQGLGLLQIIALVPYVLPDAMRFAVPGTMLFAVASVFGRFSSSNEITALKAAGITPMATIYPIALLAVAISLSCVWLNDIAVSWGREGVRGVVVRSLEEIIYSRLQQQRSYSTDKLAINVKGVQGRRLIRPTMSFQPNDSSPPVTLSAMEAELKTDAKSGTITAICTNGIVRVGDVEVAFPDTIERVIPLESIGKNNPSSKSPSQIAMGDFAEAKEDALKQIHQAEQQIAGRLAEAFLTGHAELSSPQHSAGEQATIDHLQNRLNRIAMEPWRRWANGFSCLAFVLVGAPMAIRMRNADFLTSFFLCFLPILLIYYPIFMAGVSQAKAGDLPPIAVWGGNALIAAWGCLLLRGVIRR